LAVRASQKVSHVAILSITACPKPDKEKPSLGW
jgi:hypothetical protein